MGEASRFLVKRGATPFCGPGITAFGAGVALFKAAFGCTIGLNLWRAVSVGSIELVAESS